MVFAVYRSAPSVDHAQNGETIIEISFDTRTKSDMATDTFDLLNTRVVMKARAVGAGTVHWAGRLEFGSVAERFPQYRDPDGRNGFGRGQVLYGRRGRRVAA